MPDVFISHDDEANHLDMAKREENKTPLSDEIVKEVREKRLSGKTHMSTGSVGPLSAFCFYPDGVDFETRESKEEIVLLLRQHPIVNIPWIFTSIIMLIAPVILKTFPLLSFLPSNFQFVLILAWYLLVTAFTLEKFLSWFFNIYIITDERVIDVDFNNLIYKEVSDANIDKIQDVTYNMGGVARTVFNYGNVFIETAGEKPNIEFLAVPNPAKISSILQDLMIEEQQELIEGRVR